MATLSLQKIRKTYGTFEAMKGVDLEIKDRDFTVFVGPSGCGKTTLLRMIAGLEEISGGDLLIDGQRMNDVGPADRGLAMVFQSYALYPHMTVADNMAFALRLAGVAKAERDQKVMDAAKILQLDHLLHRRPKELSGGQRQRVAIGRSIVRNPKVFLFDEPLSNLDAALRVQMRVELTKLHERLNATTIYVTHDQIEAMTMATKIVVLNGGRIEQVGSPLDLYHHPANIFVATFIGAPKMNMLPAEVIALHADAVSVKLAGGVVIKVPVMPTSLRVGDQVTMGLRPENLSLAASGLPGRAIVAEHLGALTYFHVDLGDGQTVIVQTDGQSRVAVHDQVFLAPNETASHLFGQDGVALPRSSPPANDMAPPTQFRAVR
jgi:multiple sugar transport system ATP-binding protein